jgi:hypothetical protein
MFRFSQHLARRTKQTTATALIGLLIMVQTGHAQGVIECAPSENQTSIQSPVTAVKQAVNSSSSPLKAKGKAQNKKPKKIVKNSRAVQRTTKVTAAPKPKATQQMSQPAIAAIYPATVIAVKGQAWRGAQHLSVGMQLGLNDIIQTDGNSFVSIRLGDGVTSTLPSNSRIELSMGQPNVARFKLLNGRVENRVLKAASPKRNTFEIQLPRSVLGVRGTHFLAELGQNDKQQVQVLEGTVVVQSLEQCSIPAVIDAGQGALIQGEQASDIKPLLDAPRWLTPSQTQSKERMAFLLEPVNGAEYYQAQIATDPEFLDIQTEAYSDCARCAKIEMGHVISQISNGQYYVRFMALDKNKITGTVSQYPFVRQRPEQK